MAKNKYIKWPEKDEKDYWLGRPEWFKAAHGMAWYERIDLNLIDEDLAGNPNAEAVLDLIDRLANYTRLRDRVIEHREAVMFHASKMIDLLLRDNTLPEKYRGQLLLISEYIQQMTATSALDPMPPSGPLPDKRTIPGDQAEPDRNSRE